MFDTRGLGVVNLLKLITQTSKILQYGLKKVSWQFGLESCDNQVSRIAGC